MLRNMLATTVILLIGHSVLAAEGATEPAADTGWTSLFNGKNLDGWTIKCLPQDNDKRGYWKVVDGTITAETPSDSKHNYI